MVVEKEQCTLRFISRRFTCQTCSLISLMATLSAFPAVAHADISLWQASSGLLPDQIAPPYTLQNSANPETPNLAGSVLTISTNSDLENMTYIQSGALIDMPTSFFVEVRVRFVSGSTSASNREPISIGFTTLPSIGQGLFIGPDLIFIINGSPLDNPRGASAVVDTDDVFHTYRMEADGISAGSAVRVFYDGALTLTGTTYEHPTDHGDTPRVYWGEGSSLANGTSEWQSAEHNALAAVAVAAPEPTTCALLATGLAPLTLAVSRRRRSA